uniref:Uncharacterized protein n=1 Tax=Arundo donax TaxID=35708 RepID=A0A0A9EC66_ARUDO
MTHTPQNHKRVQSGLHSMRKRICQCTATASPRFVHGLFQLSRVWGKC